MSRYRQPIIAQPTVNTVKETPEKIPHIKSQRVTANMTESQKEGVRLWNLMQSTLLNNSLMETK